MEVLIEEHRDEPWIDKKTRRRLIFLLVLVVVFQMMKQNDNVLNFYKILYFNLISPIISSIGAALTVTYVMVLIVLIIILLSSFVGFKLKRTFNSLIQFTSGLLAAFLILWGFNYSRSDLKVNPNPEPVRKLFELVSKKTEVLITNSDLNIRSTKSLTNETRTRLKRTLKAVTNELFPSVIRYPEPIPVFKDGALRKIGISGIFFPFTHQPLYDDSSPKITKWFTYSHEYFHSVSVTGEDECNALAFYTLASSEDDNLKLSAYLDVLRTCANVMGFSRSEIRTQVGGQTYALLEYIWNDQDRYVTSFHNVSHTSNDLYLKYLGTEEGVEAYNGYLKFLKIENEEITLYKESELMKQI